MKALADYVHGLGLFFGLYSDAGHMTCAGRPGSLGFEKEDAQTYADWGVDYLKYDNCFSGIEGPKLRYPRMRDALNSTGRAIFFSMCEWGVDNPWQWASSVGNSWRTTGDINDSWDSFVSILDKQKPITKFAGPGGWNDPDMLEVGNGGMTFQEYRSHFSFWAALKAPLLIGTNIMNMTNETVSILLAPEVIAVNQDPLGQSIHFVRSGPSDTYEIWAGPLSGDANVFILFNRGSAAMNITTTFATDIGVNCAKYGGCNVRCLWARKNLGSFGVSFTMQVESHGVFMGLLTHN